jgi:hypothetical protein
MTFTSIDPAHFERMCQVCAAEGVPIAGPQGTAAYDGAKIGWSYDGSSTLTITPLNLKAKLGSGLIESKMQGFIKATGS